MACHGRDLINWIVNQLAGTHLEVAQASLVYPVLTTVGALLGAFIAAKTSREFRWNKPENPSKLFAYGVVVMNCALLAGGCSIRLLLRTAAGDVLGMMGFAGMIAGIFIGTNWMRWRATR